MTQQSSVQLIMLGSATCGPCKMMQAKLETFEGQPKYKYVKSMQKVDVGTDEGKALAQIHSVRAIPTLLLVDEHEYVISSLRPGPGTNSLKSIDEFLNLAEQVDSRARGMAEEAH